LDSTNPFESITNFFKMIPPPQSDLTPAALEAIRMMIREEIASPSSPEASANKPMIGGTAAWVAHIRAKFLEQEENVNRLVAEIPDFDEFIRSLLFNVRLTVPNEMKEPIITYCERLRNHLKESGQVMEALRSLIRQVNAVAREGEE
jgi:hypothetical protein